MRELCIQDRARQTPEAVALVTGAGFTTFRELAEEAARVVFPPGLVVVSEANSRALVVKLVALLDAQRPFALLHPRLTAPERAAQESHLQAHAALVPADTAAILFTSGSSGRVKAACLPRRAFVASARGTVERLGRDVLARWLLALPLCHVGGLSVLTRALVLGTTVVLEDRFEPSAALALASHEGVTGTSLVPTSLRRLLRETDGSLAAFGTMVVGGAAASESLLEAARARGIRALCTYGMTETCAQITLETADLGAGERSSGVPLGEARVEIVPPGGVGAIHVRGPTLFSGYLGEPPPSVPFDTGDLGWLDDAGRLRLVSRRTDLIVTGGENVYPLEVERILMESDLLEDVVVFGVPSEEWGQEVRAVAIAPRHETAGFDGALQAFLKERLAPHKRPKRFAFATAFPTLPGGKIDRGALRRSHGG